MRPGLFCLLRACTLVPTWGYNVATLTSPARPSHKNQLLLYDVIGRAVAAHIALIHVLNIEVLILAAFSSLNIVI